MTKAVVARVVGRVDEDAVNLPGVHGKERLKGLQIVAVDDEVVIEAGVADAFIGMHHEWPERHAEVMVVDKLFAFED